MGCAARWQCEQPICNERGRVRSCRCGGFASYSGGTRGPPECAGPIGWKQNGTRREVLSTPCVAARGRGRAFCADVECASFKLTETREVTTCLWERRRDEKRRRKTYAALSDQIQLYASNMG